MPSYIYTLEDPRTGDIRYIGKTNDLKKRLYGHLKEKSGRTRKHFWLRSLERQGLKPIIESLEEFPEESGDALWPEAEAFWITMFKFWGYKLCNHDPGGLSGFKRSDLTKMRISIANKGRRPSLEAIEKMRATKKANLTPERRAICSASRKGKKQSPETIEKRRQSMMGHICSEETRAKIRAAKTGDVHTDKARAKIKAARARQVFSQESKDKMGAAHIGKKLSDEHIAIIRATHTGAKRSDETRAKLRESHLGKAQSQETRAKMVATQKARWAARKALTASIIT